MMIIFTLVVTSLLFNLTSLTARPGDLDSSFGMNGIITFDYNNTDDVCNDAALMKDGRLLLVGRISDDFAVIRFNHDGTIDSSFGSNGIIIKKLDEDKNEATSIAIDSISNIYVAGYFKADNVRNAFAVLKFNENGIPVAKFGNAGIATSYVGFFDCIPYSIALQKDGKVLAAGKAGINLAIVRFNKDGSLDSTFGTNGKIDMLIGDQSMIFTLAIQDDGKILAGGEIMDAGLSDVLLLRLHPDGTLDSSFNSDGILTFTFPGNHENDGIYAIEFQSDNKILIGGYTDRNYVSDYAMARLKTDGTFDSTFSDYGLKVITIDNYNDKIRSLSIQDDGKIIASGYSSGGGAGYNISLARLNPDGTLDTSFGYNGKAVTDKDMYNNYGMASILQKDKKLIIAGYTSNGKNLDFMLARYHTETLTYIIDFETPQSNAILYPNPIYNHAVIEYTSNKEEYITIELYDIAGNYIKTFVNSELKSSGLHSEILQFDDSIAAGTYILCIKNLTKKIYMKIIKE